MEVVLFTCNTLVTLITCLLVSLVKPMGVPARERVDAFWERLRTPVGELDEDRPTATSGAAVLSPFRVVGISVLLIGLMMLGILWWVWQTGDMLAFGLDVFLGGILVVIGALMARHGGPAKPQPQESIE